jgi:two-component system, OmpR family, sensor histidine kinase VicK
MLLILCSVEIKRRDISNGGKEVIVTVKDSGNGIDPSIFPRLFSKFATNSPKGTGLGLFISKSIIEDHGGRIWAKNNSNVNREGPGLHFTLAYLLSHKEKSVALTQVGDAFKYPHRLH